ncbi:MAG: uracil-DNA glycosylase [Candidatus Limnocylindria bacterium]
MDALGRLHAEIRDCTRCVAAGHIERAQPIVEGKATDRIMIVGQAPGIVELEVNHPFSGRSGVTLRAWLAEAGISKDELPYRTAVTKCFPGRAASGAGDRRPSPAEIALCAPFLEREIDLVRPAVLVLLGQLAIERFWGRVALDDAVGRSRHIERAPQNAGPGRGDPAAPWTMTLIPLPHPSGASRWLNDPANRALLRRGLRLLKREAAVLGNEAVRQRIGGVTRRRSRQVVRRAAT